MAAPPVPGAAGFPAPSRLPGFPAPLRLPAAFTPPSLHRLYPFPFPYPPPPHRAAINGRPPTLPPPPSRPFSSLLTPIKGAPRPPLHPAPLSFSPHPPAQHHRSTSRPPERRRPDLLLRRVSLLFEPLVKILVPSSFFWCSSLAKWCPGGHLGSSPASPPPPLPVACMPPWPSDGRSAAQIKRGRTPLDRSTMDRWTGSTGAGPPLTSSATSR
jgi:hypothetical protein